jgi:signal transduction histidine kinase
VLAALVTVVVCRSSRPLSAIEFTLLDSLMVLRPARQPDPAIALVGVEKGEVGWHKLYPPPDCTCSVVPRSQLGRTISRLKSAGASVIVVDLVLGQPCPYGRGTRWAHDGPLVAALAEPGETILAAEARLTPPEVEFSNPAEEFVGKKHPQRIVASPVVYSPHGVIRGVSLIQTGTPSDLERLTALPLEMVGRILAPLSLAAYAAYGGYPCELPEASGRHRVRSCDVEIPVWCDASIYLFDPIMPRATESKHVMLINWAGPAGTFPMYAMSSLRKAGAHELREWFQDKIVFIGSAAERMHTPMTGLGKQAQPPFVDQSRTRSLSGLEIHANALNTVMQGRFIRPLPTVAVWAIMFGCTLLAALAFEWFSTWPAVATALGEVAVFFALGVLLIRWDCWLYTFLLTIAVVFSGTASGLWGYALSRREAATLESTLDARDAATATIVHDLKQPLAAISGLAAAIRATQKSGAGAIASPELVQRIQKQVERALADIDELLTTDPDREIPLRCQEFDLAALARDLAVAQSTRSSVHEVEVRAPADGVLVAADPRYLGRALSNLMDNAIKYWPEGGTVIVEVQPQDTQVVIRVIDRGLGMSEGQKARIFGRFQRAVPEGLRIAGTGIGLYSVERIARAHGGTIHAESEPGLGSTFVLTIPATQPAQTQ